MKAKVFTLSHDKAKGNALAFISTQPTDGTVEVLIRNASEGKTLQQIRAIRGVVEREIAETYGHSIDETHDWIKDRFLARIYCTEPLDEAQEQWVELLAIYQESGDSEKLERHAKRISMKWMKLKQAKQMMDDVFAHFQSIGQPLREPDKNWRDYE